MPLELPSGSSGTGPLAVRSQWKRVQRHASALLRCLSTSTGDVLAGEFGVRDSTLEGWFFGTPK